MSDSGRPDFVSDALVPVPMRLVDFYDDGLDARHFTFQLAPGAAAAEVMPGQFFALTLPGVGEAVFTYVSTPDAAGRFSALVRRVGSLTTALFQLERGAVLGYRGPFGQGWPLESLAGQRLLLVAGGCGLAPLAGVIGRLQAAKGSASAPAALALIYGSRDRASQVLGRERAAWGGDLPILECFDHPDTPQASVRLPTELIPQAVDALGGPAQVVLTCGPEVMMRAVATRMGESVPHDQIWLSLERRMHCAVGTCGHCYFGSDYVCRDGPTYRWSRYQLVAAQGPERPQAARQVYHC